ncbi:MAG TPA: head-tail connector protein [Clostridia bacterium]|nr:head-tail connector protein [Clostridia bacterium]
MAVTEQALKDYLGLPPDSTTDVSGYLAAAKTKARAAGIPSFERNALYDLFIKALAANYYENRGLSFSGSYQATAEENARKLVNDFVLTLRYAEEDPIEPTVPEGGDSG